jgi:hypothetical protein
MVLPLILVAIGTILSSVIDIGKEAVSIIGSILQAFYTAIQTFVNAAPQPMKILMFLALLLTISNVFSNTFLGMRYACTSANKLYESADTVSAVTHWVQLTFLGWTVANKDTFITSNYDAVTMKPSPTYIKCMDASPRLYFYSINILDYKMWLLMIVLMFGTPMVLGYYSRMGILH